MLRVLLVLSLACACSDDDSSPLDGGGGADAGVDATTDAGPCELDTSSDPNNCGACGYVCPHRNGATASCVASACTYDCVAGFDNCNGDDADGCEIDLEEDASHCGRCGNVCPGGTAAHSDGACVGGECEVGCERGWADCNSDIFMEGTDGCEAELAVDVDHCGTCHNACSAGCEVGLCEGTTLACSYFADTLEHPVSVRLAAGDGGVLVVWNDLRLNQLFLARLDPRGRVVSESSVLVDGFRNHWRFDVGWDGSRYVVVHEDHDANETLVSFVQSDGTVVSTEPIPGSSGANSVRVSDGNGGVAAAVDGTVYWITPSGIESGPGAGEIGPRVARTADGFAAIGGRTQLPTETRPWEVVALEHASLDSSLAVRSAPSIVGSDVLAGGFATAIAPLGDGALAVASLGPDLAISSLKAIRFDARGELVSGPTTLPGSPSASVFELATDAAGGWFAYGGSGTFEPSTVRVRRVALDGAFAAEVTASTVRAGFLADVSAAATAEGVVVLWKWRSFSGGEDMHAIEGAFVRHDGTVVRPCD